MLLDTPLKDLIPRRRQITQQPIISGMNDSMLLLLIFMEFKKAFEQAAGNTVNSQIVILRDTKDCQKWFTWLSENTALVSNDPSVQQQILYLPHLATWGIERYSFVQQGTHQRIFALSRLLDPNPKIVVTTVAALAQLTTEVTAFKSQVMKLALGDEWEQDAFIEQLSRRGYAKTDFVQKPGEFAIRGSIVDVYSLGEEDPLRIEFFGDQIESIRYFDIDDQKSRQHPKTVFISPTQEMALSDQDSPNLANQTFARQAQKIFDYFIEMAYPEKLRDQYVRQMLDFHTIENSAMFLPLFREAQSFTFNYLPSSHQLYFVGSQRECLAQFEDFILTTEVQHRDAHEKGIPTLAPQRHFAATSQILAFLQDSQYIDFDPLASHSDHNLSLNRTLPTAFATLASTPQDLRFEAFIDALINLKHSASDHCLIMCADTHELQRVRNLLLHRDLYPNVLNQPALDFVATTAGQPGEIYLGLGEIHDLVYLASEALLFVPEEFIFGPKQRTRRPRDRNFKEFISSLKELKSGDYVVHITHGIALFKGITTLKVHDKDNEFLILEYRNQDKIYVPVDRLGLVQKYAGDLEHVQIDRLGTDSWEKRKSKVSKAVRDLAEKLLRIHAKREIAKNTTYGPAPDDFLRFEAEFPFEETEDQIKAIDDIEADLSATNLMDRLVCGDVGFGKTEVAMRAAMRTVLEGYQVMVLVPTTVLCFQHYQTFFHRMDKFGVKIAQVNRFINTKQIKQNLNAFSKGQIDILIGTHRLLSKDVIPHNLGLLIVDEEQRFGVTHKERIKEVKAEANVLTLTATPIPRTMHMALLGLKEISIIATPPTNRFAIKAYVAKFDKTLVKTAIESEIKRGGQVFFVHNRVHDIGEVAVFLRELCPQVRVRIAHGQMAAHELEDTILEFIDGKFDVLVSTTIIESGVDMPRVNTLIVNHAENYGLAQLYQLKGRVGRSDRQAYAYFLLSKWEINDVARERLATLLTHQELGAGFQIANRDLEIRGAGDLLGSEQSGFVESIGLELYTELLSKAVAELRGEVVEVLPNTEMKLPISALIPNHYIERENQRLHYYRVLFEAHSSDEVSKIKSEMQDRFGNLPGETAILFTTALLKVHLRRLKVRSITAKTENEFELIFERLDDRQIDHLLWLVQTQAAQFRLVTNNTLLLSLNLPKQRLKNDPQLLLTELIKCVQKIHITCDARNEA